jgi:hypothetical protein
MATRETPMRMEFSVHKLNPSGLERALQIAEAFDQLLGELTLLVSEGRYLSIVKTKLEEACFFAKKGMAQQGTNQAIPDLPPMKQESSVQTVGSASVTVPCTSPIPPLELGKI